MIWNNHRNCATGHKNIGLEAPTPACTKVKEVSWWASSASESNQKISCARELCE